MIVTIDGPAGAGKSTVARELARRLEFDFLDTGAIYRAVTLAALRNGIEAKAGEAIRSLLGPLDVIVDQGRTYLGSEDVSDGIRTAEVAAVVGRFAAIREVREFATRQQRRIAQGRRLVTEGRDQGTVVFPDAECKFFLSASETVRAERRAADYARSGQATPLDEVLAEQRRRDKLDTDRTLDPLRPAEDAELVDTSDMTIDEVVAFLEQRVRGRGPAIRATSSHGR